MKGVPRCLQQLLALKVCHNATQVMFRLPPLFLVLMTVANSLQWRNHVWFSSFLVTDYMLVCHTCFFFFCFKKLFCLLKFVSRSYYCNTVQRTRNVSKILRVEKWFNTAEFPALVDSLSHARWFGENWLHSYCGWSVTSPLCLTGLLISCHWLSSYSF